MRLPDLSFDRLGIFLFFSEHCQPSPFSRVNCFEQHQKGKLEMTKTTILNTSTLFFSAVFFTAQVHSDEVAEQVNTATPNLPDTHLNYANIELPAHYSQSQTTRRGRNRQAATEFDNTPEENPITDAGATLGRVLFYDKKLSANGTVSCASCHSPESGFADNKPLSIGFAGEQTRRHSIGLTNARFYDSGKFFWDERADTLEEQVLMPFQDEIEMGLTLTELETIVGEQSYYPELFEDAFGDVTVSSDHIAKALAQFIRSMVSTTSKYDEARAQVDSPRSRFPTFTRQENLGKSLFFRPRRTESGARVYCAGCHTSEAFVGASSNRENATTIARSNGLDAVSSTDFGVYETTRRTRDMGKFKTPSLRNIGATAPYMHDGRFETLEEVVEHYSSGIQPHRNLPRFLRNEDDSPVQFGFTETEKAALVAFLQTLTDEQMLVDERWSDPFTE